MKYQLLINGFHQKNLSSNYFKGTTQRALLCLRSIKSISSHSICRLESSSYPTVVCPNSIEKQIKKKEKEGEFKKRLWLYALSLPIKFYINLFNWMHVQGASLSKGLPSGPSKKFYPLVHSIDARLLNATIQDA